MSDDYLYQQFIMDIQDSVTYDKEQMLEALVASSGLSPEEFGRDYLLEEYPVEIVTANHILAEDYRFVVTQQFRVRLKTEEERQLEIESKENKDATS